VDTIETWYNVRTTVDKIFGDDGAGTAVASAVASAAEMSMVTALVGINPRDGLWRKCYDLAEDSTRSTEVFHAQCDFSGATMTLVTLDNGKRIAAYAEKPWDAEKAGYIWGKRNTMYDFSNQRFLVRNTTHVLRDSSPCFVRKSGFCMAQGQNLVSTASL